MLLLAFPPAVAEAACEAAEAAAAAAAAAAGFSAGFEAAATGTSDVRSLKWHDKIFNQRTSGQSSALNLIK